jgi:hypothetical protein
LVQEVPEDAERRPGRVRRCADDRDPPGLAQDDLDAGVVEDADRAAALLEIQESARPIELLAIQDAASR